MNFRTTYILLGAVVLALVALGIYTLWSGDEKAPPSVEGYVMRTLRAASVKPEDVTSVEIERPGQTPEKIAFAREGKVWHMVAPANARADSSAVDGVVSGILNAKTEKSADLSSNLAAHGLDNPVKVTLKAGASSESVSLGNVTVGGDRAVVYFTTSDQPDRPQAARRSDFSALFKADAKNATHASQMVKGVTDFRPLKMLGDGLVDPVSQVRSMAVRVGDDQLALFRGPDGGWRFRLPADYGEAEAEGEPSFAGAKDSKPTITGVRQLLNTIMDIRPKDAKQLIENPGDLSQFGLDLTKNKPMQIDFSRDDGVKETIYVAGPIKKDGTDKYFARHEADSVVAEVSAQPVQAVEGVMRAKYLLRDRTVLRVNPSRVDAIDIETNGEKIELRRVGLGWQVYDAEGKGRPAKTSAVTELLNRLTARQLATSFPPPGVPEDKMGFAKPAVEVKLWEGGIVKEEKPDPNAKPKATAPATARLLFGHKDVGDVVYARRIVGKDKADFFVPQDAYQLASRGRLEYIDASLKPFGADAVLKLTFTHGKEVFDLERPDDGKPAAQAAWKINGPERLKGRPADAGKIQELLNHLSFLRPTKVASDRVTEDVLNRLEVNPAAPRMKVTVTVKGQGERVFLFGGDAGTEKKTVYLKPGDRDLVFEVDRTAFDLFQKADVQDTVVHRIDKAKVKAVKITGWQEVVGSPTPIVIERKDGKWTLTSGGTYEVDPAKVDAFLNELTAPRAEQFVVYKDGPKPEHNLDVAKNALRVEMVLEAGDPVVMMISPPNKEGKVFATTSVLPGDVFTMADHFAAVRAKPAAFKKD
ncbi:MAG: DUF4340 domain-containing protein [Zavarzinella sp.]|nr:DUF4340 domain-containing protein [Zavarzinella sp.]